MLSFNDNKETRDLRQIKEINQELVKNYNDFNKEMTFPITQHYKLSSVQEFLGI